jgi:hypothetical protein
MHLMVDDVGVMECDNQHAAVLARVQGCMELDQSLQILPVYYSDVVLHA